MSAHERRRWEFNIRRLRKQWTDIQKAEVFARDFDHAAGGVWCAKPSCRTLITEKDVGFVTLHHLTKLGNVGTNFTENKKLAHHTCNSSLRQPQVVAVLPAGEKVESPQPPMGALIQGSQSEKSPVMVGAWDEWIASKSPWSKEPVISLDKLIHSAPTQLGKWEDDPETGERRLVKLGTAETYRKYAMTDAASGRLHIWWKKGQYWVSYVGELKEGEIRWGLLELKDGNYRTAASMPTSQTAEAKTA